MDEKSVQYNSDFTEQEFLEKVNGLGILLTISQKFASTFDLDILFQTTTDGIVKLSGLDSSAIYLLENEILFLAATTPPLSPDFPDNYRRTPLRDHPHIAKSLTSRDIISIIDTQQANLTPAEREVSEMRNLRSIHYFPIQFRDKAAGTLIVASCDQPRKISENEISLCRNLVHHAALAIQNAQYHLEVQKNANNLEKLVEERTERLNIMVNAMAGREVRMAELKSVIRKLRKQLMDIGVEPVADDPLLKDLNFFGQIGN